MNCPRDGTRLEEVKVEELVLDRCQSCGGAWFDFGVLERVLSRDARTVEERLVEHPPAPMPQVEHLSCPRCGDVLIRMRGSDARVTYYGCLTCYGRWLDGSQMARLLKRSLLAKFQKLFERLLG